MLNLIWNITMHYHLQYPRFFRRAPRIMTPSRFRLQGGSHWLQRDEACQLPDQIPELEAKEATDRARSGFSRR